MRKISLAALLFGLALALLAPGLVAARPAPCSMKCCRTGMRHGAMSMPGGSGGVSCSLRGCGGELPAVAPGGLPPSVLPVALPLPLPARAAVLSAALVRPPSSLSPDLPDQPPRA